MIKSPLELLKVAKTASRNILLKRVVVGTREALAITVVLMARKKEWARSFDLVTRNLGEEISATIGDEEFWDEVCNILATTKPICLLIKFCDEEGPKMVEI